ncbi:MAG: lactate racemase domain-containing protein [Bryobacterales bacterium]|nr:lactate racemase domain-containing protein [Bryobacterales bacterium]MEB2362549.1 lactate racemase domain-containing protein [Bryobacterales bacterium]
MEFPQFYVVKQNFPDRRIADIPAEAMRQLTEADFASRLKPGGKVAIGVGSRGIAHLSTIVRAVVDYWKSNGAHPFIFPAMGSHGAATAEGQADVLAHYGIHEATMGCPVISALEVVSLGKTAEGIEAFLDKRAYDSDGVMLVGRIKWHTDFTGKIESGLYKMMAIGLGKFAGAQQYHTFGYKIGLEAVIRSVGRQVLKSGKILGGLAILEDANHNTAQLTAVPVEDMERRDEELQALVKSWMGRIPVRELDILIIDEIGKNISGAGMDTKVINRSINCHYNPLPDAPQIHRIFLRDLSDLTYNNGVGLGMADIVTDRLVNRIDWKPTHINSLTASTPAAIRTPIHFPTDRECLERIWPTVGKFSVQDVTFGWMRNTMELGLFAFSSNLLDEIRANPMLEIVAGPVDLTFDATGNLVDLKKLAAEGVGTTV